MTQKPYAGFEQGPIRPPSEAGSLLLRVTRNCPWNRCKFCPVYKDTEFSRRPVAHVLRDIDAVYQALQTLSGEAGEASRLKHNGADTGDPQARQAAAHWLRNGRRSVFLQDADSLVDRTGGYFNYPDSPGAKTPRSAAGDFLRPLQHRGPPGPGKPSRPSGKRASTACTSAWNRAPTRSCACCTKAPPRRTRLPPGSR